MGQAPKEAERTVAAKLVHFIKRKTVASGSGRAASCMELVGKERSRGQWKITCKNVPIRKWILGLGALDGASRRRGFFEVHPEVLDERR